MTDLSAKPSYNASAHSFSGWLGGKSQLARTIIDMMPAHTHYCEVFGGAGWVLFKKSPSKLETINDVNGELINLYRIFKYHFEALMTEFETQLVSRDEFERLKITPSETLTDIQRAARFYYLLRLCYGAKVSCQHFVSASARSSRLKLGEELREHLRSVHTRLQKVTIENQSYENYYGHGVFSRDDFSKLRDLLKNIKGKFILSLNDVPEVRALFADFNFYAKKIRWSVGVKPNGDELGNELIITNFNIENPS